MTSGEHAQPAKGSHVLRSVISILAMILAVVVLSWALRSFVVHPYEIPSGSMEDTIQIGDMVFSEKLSYYFSEPQQGDIVTFLDPEVDGRTLIKRVIATEGQTIDLRDGEVYIDGVRLDESYVDGQPTTPLTPSVGKEITYPYTLGEGELWVMGDNRLNSQDSRYFGPIDTDAVTGRAFMVYWPFSDFGLLS